MAEKVVIFTLAYNARNTIRRTIESIRNQTFENFKYFILDNGSTDDTREILSEYTKIDERISFTNIRTNDPSNGDAFFWTIVSVSSADYFVWCDADDTYSPDFLEKMIGFAQENRLDVVSCGYDCIDGLTGKVMKHRALDRNLVLHDELFVDEFIRYRGFMVFLWGKLYSIPFLQSLDEPLMIDYMLCNDSIGVLTLFQHAERAGVYGEALYQYYQYPRSISRTKVEENLDSHQVFWRATKQYLESYGPISKLNEDFLYAIYLSLVDEGITLVFSADMDVEKKLHLLERIFREPLCAETFQRQADPQFRNLAARREYIRRVKGRILAQLATPEESRPLAVQVLRAIDEVERRIYV